jgi:DNA-directed RNA polymerase subunit RPC12/RpoP
MSKPNTVYYLASRCPSCGAAKTRPSATAYVYCDFCGSLADYDFRKACEQPKTMPGPVYEKLSANLQPQCEKALKANDREDYLQLQTELFDAYVKACPAAVPVRIGDPVFRKAFVVHSAGCCTVIAFDDEYKKISEAMTQATAALQWAHLEGAARVSHKSFKALLDTVIASQERAYSEELSSQYPPHPDGASADLLKRIGLSGFVQGWLPYLHEATTKLLLERTGLAREYLAAEDHPATTLSCGHCKNPIPIFAGARQCVCEKCGYKLAVEQGIHCDGCGKHLAIDQNSTDFPCPYCQRKIERVGMQWSGAFIISSQA